MLGKCTPDDIRCGLENWTNDWPPNAVEFAKACKPQTANKAMYREWESPKLPAPVDRAQAKENLDKIKKMIAGAKIMA